MKNVDVLYERIIYFQQKEGFLNDFVRTSESLVFLFASSQENISYIG